MLFHSPSTDEFPVEQFFWSLDRLPTQRIFWPLPDFPSHDPYICIQSHRIPRLVATTSHIDPFVYCHATCNAVNKTIRKRSFEDEKLIPRKNLKTKSKLVYIATRQKSIALLHVASTSDVHSLKHNDQLPRKRFPHSNYGWLEFVNWCWVSCYSQRGGRKKTGGFYFTFVGWNNKIIRLWIKGFVDIWTLRDGKVKFLLFRFFLLSFRGSSKKLFFALLWSLSPQRLSRRWGHCETRLFPSCIHHATWLFQIDLVLIDIFINDQRSLIATHGCKSLKRVAQWTSICDGNSEENLFICLLIDWYIDGSSLLTFRILNIVSNQLMPTKTEFLLSQLTSKRQRK